MYTGCIFDREDAIEVGGLPYTPPPIIVPSPSEPACTGGWDRSTRLARQCIAGRTQRFSLRERSTGVYWQIGWYPSIILEAFMARYTLRVNGREHDVDVPPETPLLWTIRDVIGLTGTKYGCGMALCGACTVHLDGQPVRSCTTAVSAVGTREVTTIEGLSPDGSHPIQRAWIAEDAPQCGYCQSGQIMSAAALLRQTASPTDEEINAAMAGNVCRCGTYDRIRSAIHRAAREG